MYGIIYKITNTINNKVYIGQTIRPMQERFERHINDSLKETEPRIHLHRAIRKYGRQNFIIECVDIAYDKQELNDKEIYWIDKLNSKVDGYNIANGGIGGNTYSALSEEQMQLIKKKIGSKNKGKLNGQSKQLKAMSIKTNEQFHFETVSECLKFFGIKNKSVIMSRANGDNKSLYKDEWLLALENEDFIEDFDPSTRKGHKAYVVGLDGQKIKFNSINKLATFLCVNKAKVIDGVVINNYKVHIES